MKKITGYIRLYFYDINKIVLLFVTILAALLIFCNYYFGIDKWISSHDFWERFLLRWFISLIAFGIPYLFSAKPGSKNYLSDKLFLFLLLIAPAIFSLKMSLITHFNLSADTNLNHYWNQIIYWPLRLFIVVLFLFFLWKKFYSNDGFFGFTIKSFEWRPYAWMLLIMVPLIAIASTQHDFLSMYPKFKMVSNDIAGVSPGWIYKLLFELSYGTDFISIEIFFRGFLILAFIKWAGKDAILPMACFYCTIHFGKPLGECISSYFGGILLGIVVYHTRSIFGGLMVHLGIAWLMEWGGYLGALGMAKGG